MGCIVFLVPPLVIDNLLTLDLLAASLKDLCPAGDVEDCGQEPWNPTRRSVLSGVFDAEDDLVEWLGELLPIQGLLRFEAQTLSRLLTFKITQHRADDVGSCNLTVEEMPVMTVAADVDRFWNQVRSDAPADRRPELQGAQWLMRILVKHFDFIFLRARMSCEAEPRPGARTWSGGTSTAKFWEVEVSVEDELVSIIGDERSQRLLVASMLFMAISLIPFGMMRQVLCPARYASYKTLPEESMSD
eukprot:s224_g8.t1